MLGAGGDARGGGESVRGGDGGGRRRRRGERGGARGGRDERVGGVCAVGIVGSDVSVRAAGEREASGDDDAGDGDRGGADGVARGARRRRRRVSPERGVRVVDGLGARARAVERDRWDTGGGDHEAIRFDREGVRRDVRFGADGGVSERLRGRGAASRARREFDRHRHQHLGAHRVSASREA